MLKYIENIQHKSFWSNSSSTTFLQTNMSTLHSGKVRGQIWTHLILKLEVRWVLNNWGKTEAFRCFFTEYKSVEIWLRYKHFGDFPKSKILAGMLKNLAAHHKCTFPLCNVVIFYWIWTQSLPTQLHKSIIDHVRPKYQAHEMLLHLKSFEFKLFINNTKLRSNRYLLARYSINTWLSIGTCNF